MIKINHDFPDIVVKLDRETEMKRREEKRRIFLCITEIITNIWLLNHALLIYTNKWKSTIQLDIGSCWI